MGDFVMIGGNPTGRVGLFGSSEIHALLAIESKLERELKTLLLTIVIDCCCFCWPGSKKGARIFYCFFFFFLCMFFLQVARKISNIWEENVTTGSSNFMQGKEDAVSLFL